ncbi:hypothetical protein [Parasitella parasitica]|uniref:Helitron helicase-like domain-containing protein n=1 Tax=Parasitella parasitica TaxID=35722 RepID=A0A0B7MXG3_9FUNG|nr:hypothetical protein [Parasitella parasitica]
MLFILDEADKPRTAEDIDCIVSAEIPDRRTHPLAHETFTTNMVYGSCVSTQSRCRLYEKWFMYQNYPFDFAAITTLGDENQDGKLKYRRRVMPENVVMRDNDNGAVGKQDEISNFLDARTIRHRPPDRSSEQGHQRHSTLTAWSNYNAASPDNEKAHCLLYLDFCEWYTFHKTKTSRYWQPRRVEFGAIIGRMYTVSPRDIERYYHRLLLLHVPGALSYKSLRTVNGVLHNTFQAAARYWAFSRRHRMVCCHD